VLQRINGNKERTQEKKSGENFARHCFYTIFDRVLLSKEDDKLSRRRLASGIFRQRNDL